MEETIGSLIRTLRKERNISAEVLASRAGVAPSTLYRWEKGETVPRLSELRMVLDALYVSPEQRRRAVFLLSSPQATAHLRAETTLVIPVVEEWASWVPGTGDLWRAMRVRRNMTGKQLADRLRISQSTVTRWEQSKNPPPLELLEALFALLQALPEERAFLSDRRVLLNSPLRATSSSLADCEDTLYALHNQVGSDASLPADLMFLVIESQLWSLAATNTTALRLLALAYTYHANYLMWRERLSEMITYVRRAETILDSFQHPVPFYLMPIGLSAHHAWQTSHRHGARKALRIFSEATELATTSPSSVSFCRTMGEYAAAAGFRAEALDWLRKSHEAAIRYDDFDGIRIGNIIRSRTLVQAGQAAEAIALLPTDDHISPYQHIFEQIIWAEALLDLGDKNGAAEWLNRFYALTREHNMDHHLWRAIPIAQRL